MNLVQMFAKLLDDQEFLPFDAFFALKPYGLIPNATGQLTVSQDGEVISLIDRRIMTKGKSLQFPLNDFEKRILKYFENRETIKLLRVFRITSLV